MFSFSSAERVPMGIPILFILFSLAVKFTQDVSVAAVAIAVGSVKQSRLVWPPPIGASLIDYGQQHHRTLVDCQMVAIRKGAFSREAQTAPNTQTLLRSLLLISGLSVWMMMGAIRSAQPSSPSTDVRENSLCRRCWESENITTYYIIFFEFKHRHRHYRLFAFFTFFAIFSFSSFLP